MRGTDETGGALFSYVDLEVHVPARHPMRKIRQVVKDALASLDGDFEQLYADFGRPSIAPERPIHASLIQILFSIRSERQLVEQMQYSLLFRWQLFGKSRDRLLTTDMSRKVVAATLAHREVAPLLSIAREGDEHVSVNGTPIKAWASMKGLQRKEEGGPPQDEGPDNPPALSILPEDQPS